MKKKQKKEDKKQKRKEKKSKENEDGGVKMPKRSNSSYIFFCMSERENIKKEYPDMNNKDITRKLGEKWTEIKNDNQKIKAFKDMADKDKERFNNEMSEQNIQKKSKKSKKDGNEGPSKNLSGYIHFCQNERQIIKTQNPELNNKQVVSEMASRWKTLKETDTNAWQRYQDIAQKDKERYLSQKSNWKTSDSVETEVVEEQEEQVVEAPAVEKKKKSSKKKKESAPAPVAEEVVVEEEELLEEESVEPEPVVAKSSKKKGTGNGYIKFTKAKRDELTAENPDLNHKQVTSELAKRWQALSASEKAEYE